MKATYVTSGMHLAYMHPQSMKPVQASNIAMETHGLTLQKMILLTSNEEIHQMVFHNVGFTLGAFMNNQRFHLSFTIYIYIYIYWHWVRLQSVVAFEHSMAQPPLRSAALGNPDLESLEPSAGSR